MYWRRMLPAR